jgi:outer membrane protein OmpA-like peptidoglycan-associated protein
VVVPPARIFTWFHLMLRPPVARMLEGAWLILPSRHRVRSSARWSSAFSSVVTRRTKALGTHRRTRGPMKAVTSLVSLLTAWLVSGGAWAESAPAAGAAASPEPAAPGSAPVTPAASPVESSTTAAPGSAPATPPASPVESSTTVAPESAPVTPAAGPVESSTTVAPTTPDQDSRRASLRMQNSLDSSTGLLRLTEAGSGAPGTFRFSLLTNYFAQTGFLCDGTTAGGCAPLGGTPRKDKASQIGARLGFSFTPLSFLEGYLGLRSISNRNNQNLPTVIQSLGNLNLGLKAFTPPAADQILRFGGAADLLLPSTSGDIGLTTGAISYRLRALATLDLSQRRDGPLPLKANLNLGWFFDNSAQLVSDTEAKSGYPVSRVERFGLGISRVDSLLLGLGVEGAWEVARPFLEWSIDLPQSRQNYQCNAQRLDRGDGCLKSEGGFSTTPSRLGLGLRVFPASGVAILGALEIGTGATSDFLDAVRPELPWNLYLGVGYAVDPTPPEPVVKTLTVEKERVVEAPKPIRHYITGRVIDKASAAVPRALVEYDGRPLTGMIADAEGKFTTTELEPGSYRFKVSAPGYRDAECQASLPATKPADVATVTVGPDGAVTAAVECPLEALPQVGTITGTVLDAATGAPVPTARIKIKDKFGRELELAAAAAGGFRFEEVPPGKVKLTFEANDYFTSTAEIEIKLREDATFRASLHRRPKKPNVTVAKNEVKLSQPIQFELGGSRILPQSQALIEELADVLRNSKEIQMVEIQGHTDDALPPAESLRVSEQRAEAVREALVALNVTDFHRAKNNRVQLVIKDKAKW